MRRPNIDRTYRMRTGLAAGLRKKGGMGLRQSLGLWSPQIAEEDEFLKGLDLGGRTVYDVGGFEGIHTIFFADRVGSLGRVVTFEPHPQNYEKVLTNVRVNGLRNVTVLRLAVGAAPGELTFAHRPGSTGHTSADPAIQEAMRASGEPVASLRVPVTSLDRAIDERGLPTPDFVKIDVEGLEQDVLAGMPETLREVRPELFVELHGVGAEAKRDNSRRVAELLLDHGYAVRHVESGSVVRSGGDSPPEGHLHARPA